MEIGKFKEYKGFVGSIEITDGKQHGIILDIDDFVNYTANSLEELEEEFHKAVDDYLITLEDLHKKQNTRGKQVLYEDDEGNYRYRGFWSGFGDQ